jgi:hypothetical protein
MIRGTTIANGMILVPAGCRAGPTGSGMGVPWWSVFGMVDRGPANRRESIVHRGQIRRTISGFRTGF